MPPEVQQALLLLLLLVLLGSSGAVGLGCAVPQPVKSRPRPCHMRPAALVATLSGQGPQHSRYLWRGAAACPAAASLPSRGCHHPCEATSLSCLRMRSVREMKPQYPELV